MSFGEKAEGSGRRIVRMDASFFDCASCRKTLQTPTFKCGSGHIVCHGCCLSHGLRCTDAVTRSYIPCPDMDRALRAAMEYCIHNDRGCTARVPYHELAGHLRSCDFVPCKCPDLGCTFRASPAALPAHMAEHRRWRVVDNFVYGQPLRVAVPDPGSGVAFVCDGRMFVMHAFQRGTAGATAVSVVCMRASEDARAVARQFCCRLWWVQGGRTKEPVYSFRLTSCDGQRLPVDPGLFLTVPDEMPASTALMIRIDKKDREQDDVDDEATTDSDSSSDEEVLTVTAVMRRMHETAYSGPTGHPHQ